ncbi:MAG: endolytic transglycosylase MltG [Chloroflexi bacterium]|nr:endolytic transglycosylase MltG [Chloroflexota bacterium]
MARLATFLFAVLVIGVAAFAANVLLGEGDGRSPSLLAPLVDVVDPPVNAVDLEDTRKEIFTVRPGASALLIGEELRGRGLVRSAAGFRKVVEQKGVGSSLAAGDYEISRSMSVAEIVEVLARGQVKRGIIATIPEGWRAEQVADRLEAVGFVTSREEFLRAVADPKSVPAAVELGAVPSLEGYLFPWTYEVKAPVSGVEAADLMVRQFLARGMEPLRRAAGVGTVKLTVQQLLTLASIVEREAQKPEERPVIASVYLNRLSEEMLLQADPTVQFSVANRDLRAALSFGYWKRDLTLEDLQADSPYNTYLRKGLPPGPICNPGEASIQAVVNPAQTGYLYFVARGDGSHLFANTLAEHNANVARATGS